MMGKKAPETCWATHKRQVINLWICCILLVNLFESYDDAGTHFQKHFVASVTSYFPHENAIILNGLKILNF
jgi:hypothetical protein